MVSMKVVRGDDNHNQKAGYYQRHLFSIASREQPKLVVIQAPHFRTPNPKRHPLLGTRQGLGARLFPGCTKGWFPGEALPSTSTMILLIQTTTTSTTTAAPTATTATVTTPVFAGVV